MEYDIRSARKRILKLKIMYFRLKVRSRLTVATHHWILDSILDLSEEIAEAKSKMTASPARLSDHSVVNFVNNNKAIIPPASAAGKGATPSNG